MTVFPADRYGLIRREATLRVGITDDKVAAAVRRGDLIRVAPGICVLADSSITKDADALYRLRCIAVADSIRDRSTATLSHDSAAALHGMPLLHPDRDVVHLTKRTKGGGFVRGHRHVHVGPLPHDDVTVIDGIGVTTLPRTAVDVAVAGNFERALVVFDRALTLKADREVMSEMLAARARWPGIAAARRALEYADPLSESVGESWSRAQIIAAGLPLPRLQHTFRTSEGEVRADFDWDGNVIGEFDGMQKYGLRPGETPREALIREKKREDSLRAKGFMVVRWTWGTLERGELVDLLRPWLEKPDGSAA
ncbi:hypothetical protein [Gordonia sp. KTR9]|uniref:hypothetical protein n=1 Tax=Gordonia sp. KTR9 TaxID=337191 RepID=UPI0005C8C837|nr:hypothetical protein [Gordonia sp. KTR9]